MASVIGPGLDKFLIAEDLVPEECRNLSVTIGVDQAMMVHYDVFMTDDRLDRFRRAFQKYLESREAR